MDTPIIDHEHGISTIDTGYIRPGFDASHLIIEGDQCAFVDVGTSYSAPRLLVALEAKGLSPDAVRYVIVTHVHLDHAGGAGRLLQELPNADLVVHPRGARHMIDPRKLIAGATAVYGAERMAQLYGEIVPAAAERVIEGTDGLTLELAGRALQFLDTPGHARHHFCVFDEQSRAMFTGDTFGLSYPELVTPDGAFVFPTTSPVQFDPAALHASIDRLLSFAPQCMYLTHFGRVDEVARHASELHEWIDRFTALADEVEHTDDRQQRISNGMMNMLLESLEKQDCPLTPAARREALHLDVTINAQGIGVWLDRRAQT